jgi:hypothetical protein
MKTVFVHYLAGNGEKQIMALRQFAFLSGQRSDFSLHRRSLRVSHTQDYSRVIVSIQSSGQKMTQRQFIAAKGFLRRSGGGSHSILVILRDTQDQQLSAKAWLSQTLSFAPSCSAKAKIL